MGGSFHGYVSHDQMVKPMKCAWSFPTKNGLLWNGVDFHRPHARRRFHFAVCWALSECQLGHQWYGYQDGVPVKGRSAGDMERGNGSKLCINISIYIYIYRLVIKQCQIECQVDCQMKCQVECQMKCQVECQMECQAECQMECKTISQLEFQLKCQKECKTKRQTECQIKW